MAKKTPARSRTKVSFKPELVLRANPKKPAQPKRVQNKTVKKHPKSRPVPVKKILNKRVRRRVFYPVVAIVLAFFVVITFLQVRSSVAGTNALLTSSAKRANDGYVVAKKEADLIKIIGTKLQRRSEIVNYQSAPNDLRAFADTDYRAFKTTCIKNGSLSNDVRYEISNVEYDKFAVIKRTCNGGTDTVILEKFDKWGVVFSGNVYPPCSLTNDLDVPQGASYYCMYNGVRYINPNP
ncbi:MAG: hypothetical protein U0491_03320 [Candidatus Saccharimonadales bacterium]